jgi:hypothetical protein
MRVLLAVVGEPTCINLTEIVSTLHDLGTIDQDQLKTILKQVKKE